MDSITRKAYAKINLALDVLYRRPDGFHEVKMVMQSIGLYDELYIKKTNISPGSPVISIICDSPKVPSGEGNLIHRAAVAVLTRYPLDAGIGIAVTLKKNIPVAAGLAGGSTDAAAVFHSLNDLLNINMDINEMCEMGIKIGADIPYCLTGGCALAEGIGEKLSPLPPLPPFKVLIVNPGISVETKWVYENLNLNKLKRHPDIDGMIENIRRNNLDAMISRMENVLETVTIKKYPVINDIKTKMLNLGAENALMSGSGPTVFGIYKDESKAEPAFDIFKQEYETYLTSIT